MGAPVRWAIAGTGRMAATMAQEFAHVPGAELVAVASREPDRAAAFAAEHGIGRGLAYRELLADPAVDVIHLATPHPQHHAIALAAIEAGKAVLVEKSFTATPAGAREVVAAARERGVFCMEAMWTRFQPAVVEARRLVADGVVGDLRQVQADLGAYRAFDPDDRLFDPRLGGGATLDLGVYLVSTVQHFLGTPAQVLASGSAAPNGVDMSMAAVLAYADGRHATIAGGFDLASPARACLMGSQGTIEIMPRFHHPSRLRVVPRRGEAYEIERPPTGVGYCHELAHVTDCVRAGATESDVMPLDDTLAVMDVLGDICDQLGLSYAEAPIEL